MKGRVERRRRLVGVATVLAVLAAGLVWGLTAALAQDESPSPATGKTTLRLGWTNDPDNLNPFVAYERSSYEILCLNYDVLVGFRAEDLESTPGEGLATAWEVSDDGLVWTFTIVEGAAWQDDTPLTARDVAFTFNYIIENEMGMFIDQLLYIDTVEAVDDTHVVFTCSRPKANMLSLSVPILPEHIWSKVDPADAASGYKNEPPIVGSGPFQTVEWKRGEYVRMEANKDYWKGAPKVDEIIYQTYQNADTMAQDLKSGRLDSAVNLPAAQFEPLNSESHLEAIDATVAGYEDLGFNCADPEVYPKSQGHPVLTDPAFRRALQWAVDKERIVEIAYNGFANPGTTTVWPDFYDPEEDYHWEPPEDVAYTFDLDRCRQELDAAGYSDGDGNGIREYEGEDIKLRLYARTESVQSQSAGKLITGWFEEVGLDIDLQVIDDGALNDFIYRYEGDDYAPDFDMFIWLWMSEHVDPNLLLSVLTTSQIEAWSDVVWSNEQYDDLYEQQQTTIDKQERIALVHEMQKIVYDESPYIVLAYSKELTAYNSRDWEGWVRAGSGKCNVWYMTLPASYLALQPSTGEEESEGGSNTALIVGIIAAVVVIGLIIVFVVRGRGGKAEEI